MFSLVVRVDQRVEELLLKNVETIKPYESRKQMEQILSVEDDDKKENQQRDYDVKVENGSSLFFSIGNPAVEITTGYIHLYKNSMERDTKDSLGLPIIRGTLVCVLAIPSFLSITEFVSFVSCFKSKVC
jgi:hypothetical protein